MKDCCDKFQKVICCDSDSKYPTPYRFNFNAYDMTPEN